MPYKNPRKNRNYMKNYMRVYRQGERDIIRQAREQLGLSTKVRTRKKKVKK